MPSLTWKGNSSQRRRGRAGFTLFELIMVLLVLALAAGAATPMLMRFTRGRQALDAAAHMLAVVQYAQDRAISTGSPQRFQLDTTKGAYWLTARQDGAFSRLGNEFGRTFTLPDTMKAAWDAPPDLITRGYLEFEPDGGHDTAIIRLTDPDGTVTLLGCASPNEPYRIVDGGKGVR